MATRLQTEIAPAVVAAALAIVAGALLVWLFWLAPHAATVPPIGPRSRPYAVPGTAAPPLPPNIVAPVAPEDARALNARVPFVAGAVEPAKPLKFAGSPADKAAAITCLAAAVLYEAGDDAEGEAAVAQVVINRLRHPAFPKTVCGVVFQGSERRTGCQFTFTCDGAMRRPPRPAAWDRARDVAERALTGHVEAEVGTATHYHADWVVPYWGASLDKIAAVHGHIFYRWRGNWGRPGAFAAKPSGGERIDPRLLGFGGAPALDGGPNTLDLANAAGTPLAALTIPGVARGALGGSIVRAMDADAGQFVLQLGAGTLGYAAVARAICKARANCMVMGWTRADRVPAKLPVMPARMQSITFLYRKSDVMGVAKAYWNCGQVSRSDRGECLPGTAR